MKKIKAIFQAGKDLALSRTALSTYLIFSGNILSAFLAFLFTVLLARKLSFADFGYFSALFSFLLLISDLADIGIGTTLSTFLPPLRGAKEKLLSVLKSAFVLQLAISLLLTLVIYMAANFLSDILFHNRTFNFLIKITSFGVFFTIMANFSLYALAAKQKFLHAAFLSAFSSLIRLVLLVFLLLFSLTTLHLVIYMQLVGLGIFFIVALLILRLDFLIVKISIVDLKKILSFTYLLGIARGLTALASRLDVLMIIALRNPTEAGIYALASRVISIYPLLAGSFSTVIAPKFSSISQIHELKVFIKKVSLATFGIICTILILIIFASYFMTVLFADKGIPTVKVFQLLLFSMIFFVGSIPAVSVAVYYLRKPHILTINSILQLVIVVFGNLIFIPKFGYFGASYSLILAYSITLALTTLMTFYYLKKKHE